MLNAPGISKYLIYIPAITFFNGIFLRAELLAFKKDPFGSLLQGPVYINSSIGLRVFQLAIPFWNVSPLGLNSGIRRRIWNVQTLFMLKGAIE